MGVAVVGAGHDCDPSPRAGGRLRDGDAGPDVGVGAEVSRGGDHHHMHRRASPPTHEPERDQGAPVHGCHRVGGVVAAKADADRGQARFTERGQHAPRERGVGDEVERDGGRRAVEMARHPACHHDSEGAGDVDVVRRGDDDGVGPGAREQPTSPSRLRQDSVDPQLASGSSWEFQL